MELTDRQVSELTDGGECYLHHHPEDQRPNHDTLNRLQELGDCLDIASDTTLTYENDHVMTSTNCTITLPLARAGKEFEVTQAFSGGTTTVLPTGSDTLVGDTSVLIEEQWTSLRFKAISGGYILI